MGFSPRQLRALKRNPDRRYVRTREAHGRELTYLEGWYAISEANRIFGFDGWSRETIESRCVLARESRGAFTSVYTAKVRLTVHAEGVTITREGHGTAESHGASLGEAHDTALKAAETDATKRALATFGRPFGLELYRADRAFTSRKIASSKQPASSLTANPDAQPRVGFHPDDTTPIPRPSHYYGRRQDEIGRHFAKERREARKKLPNGSLADSPPAIPVAPALAPVGPQKIDKSELPIGEPKRLRDRAHLNFVASQPCLVCGRHPSDPHHLRFAQPRAIGMKVSDEFTVPLCRTHHRQLHQIGDERIWWLERKISPLENARELWEQTHPRQAEPRRNQQQSDMPSTSSLMAGKPGDAPDKTEPSLASESPQAHLQQTDQTKPI